MRKLPPLNSLRAFEAAARHLSFTKAAEELNVTPGAVSQQVKLLEETVGVSLFHRGAKGLVLTEGGIAALPSLRDGFDRLDAGVRLMGQQRGSGRLAVSVAPSFASKWLVPRLDRFQERHPDIDVYVHADMDLIDFSMDDVDVAIRYGQGTYPDLDVQRLMNEKIVPVCAPKLLTAEPPLKKIGDLAHHTLLHDNGNDHEIATWPMWLKAAGARVDGTRGPRFNQSSLVIEAAVAGRGVALAKYALAEADLEAARLVIPFDLTSPTDFAYWLVHPHAKAALPEVKAFKSWIVEEATG
ncbi:transcriptional regulator, LysR family protein [Parvularcula bermudensis HTCC2503]|uniref:Transcriptional regulator, LysR family protein n=1 Tax=Parvularcula bermudensis (strain ATCC BAA-594 / HTCC2503 / KCTC 12087) TaxID=314260 RepID=E0TFQ1_PARBH|nr:transcriptional regulator GcvA [Parvularcula bermudensis]ADM09066.1 transcriptional regulator, LysR family protein [Parvularcula bermudensis HTCC2503]